MFKEQKEKVKLDSTKNREIDLLQNKVESLQKVHKKQKVKYEELFKDKKTCMSENQSLKRKVRQKNHQLDLQRS